MSEAASVPAEEKTTTVKFTIQQARLKQFITNAQTLVDEAKIHITEDGLTLRAVDPANVGMTDLTLSKEAFDSYHSGGEEAVLGANLERIADVLSMGGSGDLVTAELDSETRKLHWGVDGLEFSQGLIDPDSIRQEPDIPDLDLPAVFDLPASSISRGVKAADMVGDHIRLRFDEDESGGEGNAVIEADGDTDSVEVVVTPDRGLEVVESGLADSLFSIDYLGDIEKAFPNGEAIRVELGEEFPVKLHFEFADGHGEATYMLAPRVSSQ